MEKTERMSEKLIQDRSAILGAANTYAEVLFAALGALVASSRKDHVAKVEGDESYMQVYLADTPCDYRGVMRLCGYTVETGVQDTMDKAYEELKSKWHEKYNAIVHEMQVSAVANALDGKREACEVKKDTTDKWVVVRAARRLLWLVRENWERLADGGVLDPGVSKVVGRRIEGLEAGQDGVVVTVLKIEWRQVCRVSLPGGDKLEVDFAGRDWSEDEVMWLLVGKLAAQADRDIVGGFDE